MAPGRAAKLPTQPLVLFLLSLLAMAAGQAICAAEPNRAVAAAVADQSRPASDTARDANRKPLEVLTFAEVKPGDRVADYAAGSGYFTRLYSYIAGPSGHVYSSVPSGLYQYPNIVKGTADIEAFIATHPNTSLFFGEPLQVVRYPEKLDLFWISQNYHDLHIAKYGAVDMAAFNKHVYDSLKPGGIYFILDHQANPGTGGAQIAVLHRIEKSQVIREVEAAGFKLVAEGDALHRTADDHTKPIFDDSIRGRTDQFMLRFVKP